jgi:hypothetical protein
MPPSKKQRTAPSVDIPTGAAAPDVSFQRCQVLNVCGAQSFSVCVFVWCSFGPFLAVTLDPCFVPRAFAVRRRPRTVQLAGLRHEG